MFFPVCHYLPTRTTAMIALHLKQSSAVNASCSPVLINRWVGLKTTCGGRGENQGRFLVGLTCRLQEPRIALWEPTFIPPLSSFSPPPRHSRNFYIIYRLVTLYLSLRCLCLLWYSLMPGQISRTHFRLVLDVISVLTPPHPHPPPKK